MQRDKRLAGANCPCFFRVWLEHLFRFVPDANSPVGAEQMICCYLEQFLILLLREITKIRGTVASYKQFHKAFQSYLTDRITTYIRHNLSGQLTVQQIADHFHYSRARLSSLQYWGSPKMGHPIWAQCSRSWWVLPVMGRRASLAIPASLCST